VSDSDSMDTAPHLDAFDGAPLKAPYPWFGGKSRIAHLVWERFGDVVNYIEPFYGSGAVLLSRPHAPRIETVNDIDCYVANFVRAVQAEPETVARYANAHRERIWFSPECIPALTKVGASTPTLPGL
jgi:site-specific DNA-adenine methylase